MHKSPEPSMSAPHWAIQAPPPGRWTKPSRRGRQLPFAGWGYPVIDPQRCIKAQLAAVRQWRKDRQSP